jgi:hypothetical protein
MRRTLRIASVLLASCLSIQPRSAAQFGTTPCTKSASIIWIGVLDDIPTAWVKVNCGTGTAMTGCTFSTYEVIWYHDSILGWTIVDAGCNGLPTVGCGGSATRLLSMPFTLDPTEPIGPPAGPFAFCYTVSVWRVSCATDGWTAADILASENYYFN